LTKEASERFLDLNQKTSQEQIRCKESAIKSPLLNLLFWGIWGKSTNQGTTVT